MIDRETVAAVERRTVRAVPAVESTTLEGWHVPFGRGQVRRANAVTTFGTTPWDLFETVETVERRYQTRQRAVVFRLTDLDAELDDLLFARGYERSGEVVVMTGPAAGEHDASVSIATAATPSWLADLRRLMGSTDERVAELGESLSGLTLRHGAFRIADRAVGLAVIDDGWVGLFDVAVAEEHRRGGLGRRICSAMLAWAVDLDATNAYVQVLADNTPALGLYRALGLSESYRYWYRTLKR